MQALARIALSTVAGSAEGGGRETATDHERDDERGGLVSRRRRGDDADDRADKYGDGQKRGEQSV
jgi:hypothetical protein